MASAPPLVLLNVYCPDRDVGIRLQFTPASTVEEAIDQTVRRLFSALPPPPPASSTTTLTSSSSSSLPSSSSSSSSSSPSPFSSSSSSISAFGGGGDQGASLEEAIRKPWRFLCLASGSNEGGSPFFLYRERTLASYNLRDEDELDLVLPDRPPQLVKISIRDNQSSYTQRVEEDTTVWEVVHKITRKIADSAQHPLDEYALFTADGKSLREDDLLATHAPSIATKLEFRRMHQQLKDLNQLHLRVVNTCGDQKGLNECLLGFNRTALVKDVLRRALKLFPIKDRFSAALFVPASQMWMPLAASLDELRLEENAVIELRPLYKSFTLTVPLGKDRITDVYKFRAHDTVQDLYDLLLFNNLQVSESKEKYKLCNKAGVEFRPQMPIWSYGIKSFEVRVKLQPVAIVIMGREQVVDIDFSAPVDDVIRVICRRFRIDTTQTDKLTLHSPAVPAALNPRSSLNDQNVPPSCALIVKMAAAQQLPTPSGAAKAGDAGGDGAKGLAMAAAAMVAKRSGKGSEKPPKASKAGGGKDKDGAAGDGITVGTVKVSLEQLPSTLTIGKEDTGKYGERVNIWTEPEGPQYCTLETGTDGKTVLLAGTLNKLVIHLTSATATDVRYMHAFLMTYLSFTNPRTLLNKLIERYHVPAATHSDSEVKRIQLRVCNVLKYWVSQHFDDFDHDLIQTVVNFVDESLAVDGHDSVTGVLRNAIVKRTCGLKSRVTRGRVLIVSKGSTAPAPKLERRHEKWRRSVQVGAEMVSGAGADVAMSIFDFDEEEVARQLTLREFLLYREIKSSELLDQAWNKEKLHHKAFNVLHMIQKWNETSMWVISLILEPVKAKYRAKRWESLIKIAKHVERMNNFNLLMALVSGMNNACVARLKWTKALMSRKSLETLERLETLMSPEGSYKAYRETLASINPPCIPFIAVHLSDLVFMEDGNPDETNGLINWYKRSLVHRVIDLFGQYQNSGYNLTYVGAVATFLDDMTCPSEKELFEVSLQREPRNAQKNQIL